MGFPVQTNSCVDQEKQALMDLYFAVHTLGNFYEKTKQQKAKPRGLPSHFSEDLTAG